MKRLFLLIMLCSVWIVPPISAAVSLNLPDNVTIVAANGLNTNLAGKVQLPDGLNQIAIRFEGELGRTSNDREMAYSDVFVVTFRANKAHLSMQSLGIHKESQLENFNHKPNIRFVDQHGKEITTYVDKLEKEGFQLMRDYQQELVVFNATDSPAAIGIKTVQPSPAPPKPQAVRSAAQSDMAEEMLKYWYQQADEATRQRFRDWINN